MGAPLEFLFALDAKIDGQLKMLEAVEKSIEKLHELGQATSKAEHETAKVEGASHRAAKAHEHHAKGIINVGHAFEEAKEEVHGFLDALGLVLVYEGIEKLVDKTVEWGEEVLKAAGAAERTEKSFAALQGKEQGRETIEEVEAIAKHTEFATEKVLELTAGLLRVGFAGEGLRRARAAALDLAALPGGNLEDAAGALERIQRTGRVDNRTLGGLGFGEKDFLAAMAKRTGKPSDVLKKDMEKGKLDVNNALESLYDLIHKRTGKALGSVGVEMSETLSAHITHLKEAPEELYKALSQTEAFDELSAMLGDLAEQLEPDGEIGKHLVSGLKDAFTEVADFVAGIDWADGFKAIEETIKETLPLLKAMADFAGEAFGAVAKAQEWQDRLRQKLFGAVGVHVETDKERDKRELEESPEMKAINAKIAEHKAELARRRAAGAFDEKPSDAFERINGKWVPRQLGALFSGRVGAEDRPTAPQSIARPTETFIQGAGGKWQLNPEAAGAAGKEVGKATGEGIVAGAKEGLGTHSPSSEFEWIGRMSAAGFQRGIEGGAAPGGAALAGGRHGGGPVTMSLNVNVNEQGHGDSPQQVGQEVASQLASLLPGMLVSAVEKLQIEAGA
jgi:hypothetical protein